MAKTIGYIPPKAKKPPKTKAPEQKQEEQAAPEAAKE